MVARVRRCAHRLPVLFAAHFRVRSPDGRCGALVCAHALAGINLRSALRVLAVAHVSSLPELVVGNGTNSGRIHRRRRSSHSSQALGVSPCGAGALVSAAWGQQPLASKQQPSRVPSAAAPSEVVARTLASSQPAATASSSSRQQQPGAQRAEQCQWCERYAQLNWRRRQQAQVL